MSADSLLTEPAGKLKKLEWVAIPSPGVTPWVLNSSSSAPFLWVGLDFFLSANPAGESGQEQRRGGLQSPVSAGGCACLGMASGTPNPSKAGSEGEKVLVAQSCPTLCYPMVCPGKNIRVGPSNPRGGRVGILWPVFTSEPNRWPQEPWHKVRNSHLISGIMKLQGKNFGFPSNVV